MITFGEFVEGLLATEEERFSSGVIWLKHIMAGENYPEWAVQPLDVEGILALLEALRDEIWCRLIGISSETLYKKTREEGLSVLSRIMDRVAELGIQLAPVEMTTFQCVTPSDLVREGQDLQGGRQ